MRLGGLALAEARIGSVVVRVALIGIGPASAARAIREILDRERPDVCIAAGLSGALKAGLDLARVVVPRRVGGAQPGNRMADGYLVAPWLVDEAEQAGARVLPALVSTERVLVRPQEKAAWAGAADIVDMESASVLEAAAAASVPALAIRVISDTAWERLPLDFNRVLTPHGEIDRGRLAMEVARRPWRVGALVRFGRASARAAEALASFLDGYVERLGDGLTRMNTSRLTTR